LNKLSAFAIALFASTTIGTAWADQDDRKLDHVFVIMMGTMAIMKSSAARTCRSPIRGGAGKFGEKLFRRRASEPDELSRSGRRLEFRHPQRQEPELGSTSCTSTLRGGPSNENSSDSSICPVSGDGVDEATPALDTRTRRAACRRHQHRR